jgi:dTMP kinase
MYITVEGIDTAGKTTQITALKELYPDALFTKEPGGTPAGNKLREIALFSSIASQKAELFIFLADRAEHVQEVIIPNQDKIIVSDRSVISGAAYGKASGGFSLEKLVELNRFACEDIFPQKAIILHLDKKELVARLQQKNADKIEERGIEYLLHVQTMLIEAAKALEIEYLLIDASLEKQKITDMIQEFIAKEPKK